MHLPSEDNSSGKSLNSSNLRKLCALLHGILEKTGNSSFQEGPKHIYLHFIERQARYMDTKMAVVSL